MSHEEDMFVWCMHMYMCKRACLCRGQRGQFLPKSRTYAFWLGSHPASANDPLLSALQSTGVVNMMKTMSTLLYGCWDPNAGPYTMQQMFFTTELSLWTRKKNIL